MKKICFIAQFPPPIHGLSKAVETLYNSELSQEYAFEKIDITNNKKFLINLIRIYKSKADLFYFTISQTKAGNIRDLIIFRAIGKRPCLIHLHGGYYRTLIEGLPKLQKKINYKTIGKIEGAIVLGPSLKWVFESMLPDNKIFIVPNCVDNEYLINDDEFENKIVNNNIRSKKHILYLSNFIRSKGFDIVLDVARMCKSNPEIGDFHFDFAGEFFEEKEKNFFDNFVIEHKLQDIVTFHGVVTGYEKRQLLKNCTYFALPTKYPKEGQPISILEAMGNGLVILSTKHAGIPDLAKDKENGCIKNNSNDLATAYYNYISKIDNDLLEQIQRRNREKVIAEFREEEYIQNMKKCFEMVLNKG